MSRAMFENRPVNSVGRAPSPAAGVKTADARGSAQSIGDRAVTVRERSRDELPRFILTPMPSPAARLPAGPAQTISESDVGEKVKKYAPKGD